MAIPKLEIFKDIARKKRGNMTKIAEAFNVERSTVYGWIGKNVKFKQVIDDARGRMFDDCLSTAEVIAHGIPERDEDGTLIGWKEKPDSNMLRYLMSTLGKKEGFGESLDVTTNGNDIGVQLIFSETPLSAKDLEDIRNIQNGDSDTPTKE